MNRQKFLAELSRLLGFMSSWDREAEMNRHIEMLDAAEDEAALIESLGTPTQIAISIARDYKPTPRPGTAPPEPEPSVEPAPGTEAAGEAAGKDADESAPEAEAEAEEPVPPPPPPPKKRDELQIVTDGEFEYGMELAILMGEPISAAVESALNGEYLPDPDFSLEEILREARGETEADSLLSESGEASAGSAEEEAAPEPPAVTEAAQPGEDVAAAEPEQAPGEADTDTAVRETAQEDAPEQPAPDPPSEPEPAPEAESTADAEREAAVPSSDEAADKPGGEASGNEKPAETESEAGPVFDASTAPLPESVKSAGDEAVQTGPSAEDAGVSETQSRQPQHLVFDPANFAPLPPDEPTEEAEAEEPGPARRAVHPAGTAVYVLFALMIGIPVTLLLILTGVPVLLLGMGAIAGTVYAGMHIITALGMFSDVLLVVGAGLAICALGLLIAWLGLWLSIELGSLWINAVMLRLGRALCFKREADA